MNDEQSIRYVLTLTEGQAKVVGQACELYCRLHIGQLTELNHELLLAENKDNICERRNAADALLLKLKELYFPQLHGHGHSYGVGKYAWADRAWDVYTTLRYRMSWYHHPEGGIGVNFDCPMQFGDEPLPKCEITHEQKMED